MIFSHVEKIGFAHIPKTGGMSITAALRNCLTNPVELDFAFLHCRLQWLKDCVLRSEFDSIRWLAVRRDPVELLQSSYADVCRHYHNNPNPLGVTQDWIDEMRETAKLTFAEHVEQRWFCDPERILPGGFLRTHCGDSSGKLYPNVTVIEFSSLQTNFDSWAKSMGLAAAKLPHINRNQHPRPVISEEVRRRIYEFCSGDIYSGDI